MKLSLSTLVYTAIGLGAIAAVAFVLLRDPGAQPGGADRATLETLKAGDMKKLVIHDTPRDVSKAAYTTDDGGEGHLADHAGRHVVLNFWATWCGPCREEMPTLSALQAAMGGDTLEVVTIATGRNPPPAMRAFFDEIGVDNLPLHRDPQQKIARDMDVLGLPITVILSPSGREVARLKGEADWNSDSARAILSAMIGEPTGG
ncbi:TlpA disulfide reductase family protein [Sediminimonas sp.]|uniref:TlpA family protein disulfide reductase n=1 Tax=Sediminimonas sp. TaxID=2823379 RepID=UPI0025E41654|nr:TlpA disulfide reductase family protein [Sediminimonas sp.]